MALNMLEGFPLADDTAALARAPAPAPGGHQAGLRRPRSLDRRSGSGARAGRRRCSTRRTPPRRRSSSIPRRRAPTRPGDPERRHHRLRGRRRAGQHRQRDPEPVQRVRLGRGAAGHRVLPAEPRPPLQRWTPSIPASLAPGKRPFHTLMAVDHDARRPAADGLRHHGRQRTGHVPRPGAHQRLRLRARHPGRRSSGPRLLIGAFLPDEPADLIRLESRGAAAGVRRAQATGPRDHARRRSCSIGSVTPTA